MQIIDKRENKKTIAKVGDMIVDNELETRYFIIVQSKDYFGALDLETFEVVAIGDNVEEVIEYFDMNTTEIVSKEKIQIHLI